MCSIFVMSQNTGVIAVIVSMLGFQNILQSANGMVSRIGAQDLLGPDQEM